MLIRAIDREKHPGTGDGPRIEESAASPYWAWVEPRPAGYDTADDIIGGGAISPSDEWGVWYDGVLLPDADADPWTEHMLGAVTHSCTKGRFKITDDDTAEYLYYTHDVATLDNTVGTLTDVRIRIDAASSARNQGACLSVADGTYQFMVWLRTGSLNIDGEQKVAVDLTGWHRLQFWTQGTDCEVFIDGVSMQTGMRMDISSETQVAFGSWVPSPNVERTIGRSISEWDWVRTRGLEDYLEVEAFEMALNSVTATYYFYDFDVGDYQIIQWYHADEAVDGDSSALAIFEGADVLWATESDGFLFEWIAGGTDANQVLFKATYLGTELVLYDETAPREIYGPDYPGSTQYYDESGTTGDGETTLVRRGQLSDSAYL